MNPYALLYIALLGSLMSWVEVRNVWRYGSRREAFCVATMVAPFPVLALVLLVQLLEGVR